MRPFINVEANSIPEAYEKMLLEIDGKNCWGMKESYAFDTKFDRILECESRTSISNILQEPMISGILPDPIIRDFPTYVSDILLGTKDYMIGTSYDYTYHDRIFHRVGGPGGQITYVIKKLGEAPYSNRAQITTWVPELDSKLGGPPCLQRIWFKIEDDTLHFETDWRSRDLYSAWYENVMGMAALALLVKTCLDDYYNLRLSNKIFYVDKCNSLHVYEKTYPLFKKDVETLKKRTPRGWKTSDEHIKKLWGGKELFSPVMEVKRTIFDPIFKGK